ncbi:hypothetical protein, partial [Helicobacter suis]|uniref:hypothetical protein n=1 Tax=Helicobacter suis TaxID=104628 RepID=UPI0024919A9E
GLREIKKSFSLTALTDRHIVQKFLNCQCTSFLQKIPYLSLANRRRRGKAHHEPVAKCCLKSVENQHPESI